MWTTHSQHHHTVQKTARRGLEDLQQLTVEREKGFQMLTIKLLCCYCNAAQTVHAVCALKLRRNVLIAGLVSFIGPGSQFVIKVMAWDGKMLGLPGAVHAVTDIGIHSCIT